MKENRGRPSLVVVEAPIKYSQEMTDYTGARQVWKYDLNITKSGPISVENFPFSNTPVSLPKIDSKPYNNQVTVMVYKSSNRSNATVKLKVFNKNIDYVNSAKKLPGVPDSAVILELAIGEGCIPIYKQKYNI